MKSKNFKKIFFLNANKKFSSSISSLISIGCIFLMVLNAFTMIIQGSNDISYYEGYYNENLYQLDISQNKDSNYTGNTGYETWYYYIGGIINSANGNLFMAMKDISFQVRGFKLEIIRCYNSHNADYQSTFGNGWTYNYNIYLKENNDASVVLIEGDGSFHNFTSIGGGNYVSPPGIHMQLKKTGSVFKLRTKNGEIYHFNSSGVLTEINDKNENSLTFSYTDGNLSTITDDSGLSIIINYDFNGRVKNITDPLSRVYEYQYDFSGNLVNVTDPTGNIPLYHNTTKKYLKNLIDKKARVLNFTYSNEDLPKVLTIGNSHYNRSDGYIINPYKVYSISYDLENKTVYEVRRGKNYTIRMNNQFNPIEITNPLGYSQKMIWDSNMHLLQNEDANQNNWSYSYDAVGNLISKTLPLGQSTYYSWENLDNDSIYISLLNNITDYSGTVKIFDYDENYNLNRSIDAKGSVERYTYDDYGYLINYNNTLGYETVYTYDNHGYLLNVTDALGNNTFYTYDSIGRVIRETDKNGFSTDYECDDLDRLVRLTDARSNVTKYIYDELGNLIKKIDGNNNTAEYSINYINKPDNVTNPSGNTTLFKYDKFGNLIDYTDENGVQTQYEFDELDRIISVTDTYSNTETYTYDNVGNLIRFVNKRGYATDYEYDAMNRNIKVTNALGGTTFFEYDNAGHLINITDPKGFTTTYNYDMLGQISCITDALGNTTHIEYDSKGNIINITNSNGYSIIYTYDPLNRLIFITDTLGNKTTYNYDAEGNLLGTVNPSNYSTTFDYDELNRLIRVTDALGNSTEYNYDAVGNVISIKNRLNDITNYNYDNLYRVIKVTDATGNETQYNYDANGNLLRIIDAKGYTTQYRYDALDRLIKTIDASGNQIQYNYDEVGNLITMIDRNGFSNTYQYDALNRLISVTDALGYSYYYSYDAIGNIVNYTNKRGYTTSYTYDSLGRLIQTTDSQGYNTNYEYDAIGNLISFNYKGGKTIFYEYDGMNRLIKSIDEIGYITEYNYDNLGNIIEVIDRNGNSTNYEYDSLNRLIKITDTLGSQTKYKYDAESNLIQIKDPLGIYTNYTFDAISRILNIEYNNNNISFSYDGNGNIKTRKDQQGFLTNYSYDPLNRLIVINYPDLSYSYYNYDNNGNLIQSSHVGAGLSENIDCNYDSNGRLTDLSLNYGSFIKTINYNYDSEGNIISMTDPEGGVTNYNYDSLNRLIQITDPSLRVFDISYDAIGRRSRLEYPNGIYHTYIYDDASRLLNMTIWDSTPSIISFYNYSYDNLGNKKIIHSSDGNILYTYDNVYRLIGINSTFSDMTMEQTDYTYDANGNRLTKIVNGITTYYTYTNNQLISEISNRTINFSYDPNGNLILKQDPLFGTKNYNYDFDNMLTSVDLPSGEIVGYDYSSMGARLRRFNATDQTYYFYDFEDILSEYDMYGNKKAGNIHSDLIDEPLAKEINNNLYFYHLDKTLSVRLVTNMSSNLVSTYRYSAFGEIQNQTGIFDSEYLFTSREKDNLTNLYFYRSRYYDPIVGRFISEDPLGAYSGTNLYQYVGNNPVNFIDPFGRGTILEQDLKKEIEGKKNHIEMKKQEAKKLTDEAKKELDRSKEELEKAKNVPGSSLVDASGALGAVDTAMTVVDTVGSALGAAGAITVESSIFAASTPIAAIVAPVAAAVGLVADLISIDVQNHIQAANAAAGNAAALMAHAQHYIDDIKDELKELEDLQHRLNVEQYFEKFSDSVFDGDTEGPNPPTPSPNPNPPPPKPTGGGGAGGGPVPRGGGQPPKPTPTPTPTPTPRPTQGGTPTPSGSTPIPEPEEGDEILSDPLPPWWPRPHGGFVRARNPEPPRLVHPPRSISIDDPINWDSERHPVTPTGIISTQNTFPPGVPNVPLGSLGVSSSRQHSVNLPSGNTVHTPISLGAIGLWSSTEEAQKNTMLPKSFSFPWMPRGVNYELRSSMYALSSFAPFPQYLSVFYGGGASLQYPATLNCPPVFYLEWNDVGIGEPANIHNGDYRNIGDDNLTVTIDNYGDYGISTDVDFLLEKWEFNSVNVLNEGFEAPWVPDNNGDLAPPGWEVHNFGDIIDTWQWGTYPHTGTYSAGIYSTFTPQFFDEWLITDSLNFTDLTNITLSFYYYAGVTILNSNLNIFASNDGSIDSGSFVLVDSIPFILGTWQYIEIDLSMLAGEENIHLAFIFTGFEPDFIEFDLDDVLINGDSFDWDAIDSGSNGPYDLDPEVWVESFFDVFYDLEGEYRATFSLDTPLRSGSWFDDNPENDEYIAIYNVINDSIKPVITDVIVNPPVQRIGSFVNISCNVSDNFGLSSVKVNITYPDYSFANTSMNHIALTNIYYYNCTYSQMGTYYFNIWAEDIVRNLNFSTGSFTVQDQTPPVTRLLIEKPFYIEDDGSTWVTSTTKFYLSASDNDSIPISAYDSGINETFYQVDYEPPLLYNGAFNLTGYPPDIIHSIRYWSVDSAGNPETPREYHNIIIDDSPPELNNGSADEGESGIYAFTVEYNDINLIPGYGGRTVKLFREVIGDEMGDANDQHPRKIVDYEGNEHFVWMRKNDTSQWEIYYKEIDPDGLIKNTSQPSKKTNKILVNTTIISDSNDSNSVYPSLTWEDHEEVFLNDSGYDDRYGILAAPVRSYIDQDQHAYNNKVQVVNLSNPGYLWQEFVPTKSLACDISQDLHWWIDAVIYKNPGYNFTKPLNLSVHPQLLGFNLPNLSKVMFKQSIQPWDILDNYSWLAFWGNFGTKMNPGDNLQPGLTYYIVVESDDPYEWCYSDNNDYSQGKSSLGPSFDFTFIERYDHPEIRFKHELSMMRSYLLSQGYSDSDLYVLTIPFKIDNLRWRIPSFFGGGYTDPNTLFWPWQPLPYDFSGESSWIDGDATQNNLGWALNQLEIASDSNDLVFIYLANHGGGWNQSCGGYCNGQRPGNDIDPHVSNDEIHDNRDECFCTYDNPDEGWIKANYWYDDELDVELDDITYEHMVVVVDTCHAGGFIPDIIGPNRIILVCGREDETTYSYRYRFYERIDYGRSPNADVNGDNRTSVREAHFYAAQQLPIEPFHSSQEPQVDIWDNIHVVWMDERDDNTEIYYSKLGSIINCSSSNNGVDLTNPDFIISDDNNSDSGRIVDDTVDGINALFIEHPDVTIDSDHNIHIIWSDNRTGKWQIFYQKQDNDSYPNILINDLKISGNTTNNSCCPTICVDCNNSLHIAWQDNAQNNGTWEIMYQKQAINGSVLIDDKLATSNDGYNSTVPDIAVDTNQYVHIVFMDDRADDPGHIGEGTHKTGYWEVYTLVLKTDGTRYYEKRQSDMENSSTIYGDYTGPPDGYSMYPQIAVSGGWRNGDTFLTWHDNRNGNWEIYYTEIANWCNNPSNDTQVTSYSKEDMYPTIALNRDNDPDIKWQRNNSWDIYGSTRNVQMFIKLEIDGVLHHMLPASFYWRNHRDGSQVYMYGTPLTIGMHNYSFIANNGLLNSSTPLYPGPMVNESLPPEITDVNLEHSNPLDTVPGFGWENVTCTVTDNINVDTVKINITYPDMHIENHTMILGGGGSGGYYYNTSLTDFGSYSYFIWANNTYDNKNISSVYYFELPPNYDIDSDGYINIMDINLVALIFGNLIDPPGSKREDVDNDGFINIMDINIVALHFGETWI